MSPTHEQIGREESDPQISQIPADVGKENNHESNETHESEEMTIQVTRTQSEQDCPAVFNPVKNKGDGYGSISDRMNRIKKEAEVTWPCRIQKSELDARSCPGGSMMGGSTVDDF